MRQVAIPRSPGMDIDLTGRRIDADRVEGLPGYGIDHGDDIRIALVREIVVLVDREDAVAERAAREAVRVGQPAAADATGEADRDQVAGGILDENVVVTDSTVIGEYRPAGERLGDPYRRRQTDGIGDQIAGNECAGSVESEEVKLSVRELRDDRRPDLTWRQGGGRTYEDADTDRVWH